MALTDQEKARRRLAANARNQAYAARKAAYRAVEQPAEQAIAKEIAGPLAEAAAAIDAINLEWCAKRNAIEEEIAVLKAEAKNLEEVMRTKHIKARKAESAIYARRNAAIKALQDTLAIQFPDLVGAARFYVSAWKPLEEFLDAKASADDLQTHEVP